MGEVEVLLINHQLCINRADTRCCGCIFYWEKELTGKVGNFSLEIIFLRGDNYNTCAKIVKIFTLQVESKKENSQ